MKLAKLIMIFVSSISTGNHHDVHKLKRMFCLYIEDFRPYDTTHSNLENINNMLYGLGHKFGESGRGSVRYNEFDLSSDYRGLISRDLEPSTLLKELLTLIIIKHFTSNDLTQTRVERAVSFFRRDNDLMQNISNDISAGIECLNGQKNVNFGIKDYKHILELVKPLIELKKRGGNSREIIYSVVALIMVINIDITMKDDMFKDLYYALVGLFMQDPTKIANTNPFSKLCNLLFVCSGAVDKSSLLLSDSQSLLATAKEIDSKGGIFSALSMSSLPNANSSLEEVDNILLSFLDEDRLVSELTIGIAKQIDTRYARELAEELNISRHSHLGLNRDNLPKNTLLKMLTLEVFSQDPKHYTKVLLEVVINEYIKKTIDKTISPYRIIPLTSEELAIILQNLPIHAIRLLLKLNKYLEKKPITTCDIKITAHQKSVLAAVFKENPCDSVMKILGMSHEEIKDIQQRTLKMSAEMAIFSIARRVTTYAIYQMPPKIIEFFANINDDDLNGLKKAYINKESWLMHTMFLCKLKDMKDDNINFNSIKQCIQTVANDFNPMFDFLEKLASSISRYDYYNTNIRYDYNIDDMARDLLRKSFDDDTLTQEEKNEVIDISNIYGFYNKHKDKDFAVYACVQHINYKTPLDKVSKFRYFWRKFKWNILFIGCMMCLALCVCCVYNINYIWILLVPVVYYLIRLILNTAT